MRRLTSKAAAAAIVTFLSIAAALADPIRKDYTAQDLISDFAAQMDTFGEPLVFSNRGCAVRVGKRFEDCSFVATENMEVLVVQETTTGNIHEAIVNVQVDKTFDFVTPSFLALTYVLDPNAKELEVKDAAFSLLAAMQANTEGQFFFEFDLHNTTYQFRMNKDIAAVSIRAVAVGNE